MTRKKMAVGGLPSVLKSQRRYWFDDNDGLVEFDVNQEPTSDENVTETTPQASSTIRRTTPKRSNQNAATKSNNIVTIGTKNFGTAFKQARVAGLDKFRWKGKVYGTKTANEVGKTKQEKASNAAKPVSKTSKSTQSKKLNNPKDAVNVSYTNSNGRIEGQLPNVTVTGKANRKPVMSWRDYVDAAKQDPSIKNTSGYKAARKQEFERMRTKAAGPGTQRWANNKRPGQGNNVQTYTKYRRNNPYIVSRGNGFRSVGNEW